MIRLIWLAALVSLPLGMATLAAAPGEYPRIDVPADRLPFRKQVLLEAGQAYRIVLPNLQEVAVWCRPTREAGVERLLEKQDLVLDWGEKPFHDLKLRQRQLLGNPAVGVNDWHSYIKQGSVITWSGKSGCERHLYAAKYKIVLKEDAVQKGKIPLEVHVQQATTEELEDQLVSEELKAYFLPRLKAKEPATRIRAIGKLLGYVQSEELGSTFERQGLHPQGSAIRDAIAALSQDPDGEVRAMVEKVLCILGDEAALLRFIKDGVPDEYRHTHGGFTVAMWCRNGGGEKVATRILPFVESVEEDLVLFALGFFTNYSSSSVKPKLTSLLQHPSPRVQLSAMEELRSDKEARGAILSSLRGLMVHEDKAVRRQAVQQAWRRNKELISEIVVALKDKEPTVREAAAYALDCCRDPRAVDALLDVTADRSSRVRAQAAVSLGRIADEKAFDRVVELLVDESPEVRSQAANGLRWFNQPRAIPHLRKRLEEEKEETVRQEIENAIRTIRLNSGR